MNKFITLTKKAWLSAGLSLAVLAMTAGSVLAAPNYVVTLSTTSVTGLTLSLAGNASANPYVGQSSDQHVTVTDWGDGSPDTAATTNFTFTGGNGNNKSFSGTWSASHTYASSGTYTIVIEVHHANPTGAEGGDLSVVSAVIVIPPPNGAPSFTNGPDGDVTIDELTTYDYDFDAEDPEDETLTYSLSGHPAGSSIDSTSGDFSWTPTEAQGPGDYTFDVVVSDGELSDTLSVTIHVLEVNLAPVTTDTSATTHMDDDVDITLPGTDGDIPAQSLTFTIVNEPDHGSVSISGNTATYSPNSGYTGSDSFSFKANDGVTDSNTSDVEVTIDNDAPTITDLGSMTEPELELISFSASATDPNEGDVITYSLTDVNGAGATLDPNTGAFSWTPSEAQGPGTFQFTICASDGGDEDCTTFDIEVTEVNQNPIADNQDVSTDEDTAVVVTLTASDADLPANALSFALGTSPASGSFELTSPNQITYTPDPNFNGTDSFTFEVSDGAGGTAQGTINVTINPVNDPPTITLNGDEEVAIQVGGEYSEQGATCSDPDGDETDLEISGTVDTGTPGSYLLTYNCTDGDEDSSQVFRTVNVQEAPAACSDLADNDGDGLVDMEDPGCSDPSDNDETDPLPACMDGQDNDEDGLVDMQDPGCDSPEDNDETNSPVSGTTACSDGIDNDEDGLVDMEDPGCDSPEDDREHNGGRGGNGGGGSVLGASTGPEPQVLGESCGMYITTFIKLGNSNDAADVTRLQTFLNENMGSTLPVTGFFGNLTMNVLKSFQVKYKDEVLTPWASYGLTPDEATNGTGYVYKTTQRWINMLKCAELNLPVPPLP
jgi:hypothetical protein